jgi:hypothetical protein
MRKNILWGKLIKVIIQKTEISDTKLNANKPCFHIVNWAELDWYCINWRDFVLMVLNIQVLILQNLATYSLMFPNIRVSNQDHTNIVTAQET